jgi:hypothetical protein
MLQKKVHAEEKGHMFESTMQIVVTTDETEMASCIITHADVPNSACEVWCTTKFHCNFVKKFLFSVEYLWESQKERDHDEDKDVGG